MYRSRFAFALAMAALAAILLPSSLSAQITFQRTYGGPDYDCAYSVQQTTDGGYIMAGFTWSYGSGLMDVYVVKTDSTGNKLWTRTFGGTGYDVAYSVKQTADGGYIVAGSTDSYGAGGSDVYLIRTDANGDTLWTKTPGGLGAEVCYSVQQTFDSGFVLAGYTDSSGASRPVAYLIKTDANGDTLWTRTYHGRWESEGRSVRQTADSGFIVAGTMGDDVYLVKTDAKGDTQWTRTFGGADPEYGRSVQQTADGGYIIAGETWSFGAGGYDVYLIKTDANGDTLWTRTFGDADYDYGWSVQQTPDAGYVVCSSTAPFGPGYDDIILIKTDSIGDTLWTKTFGGDSDDVAYEVQQTSDGGYVLAGYTESFHVGRANFYLIKTDSLGNVAVAEPKASPTRAPALSLTCEPNPCRGSAVLHLTTGPLDHSTTLRVYDAQGRLVLTQPVRTSSFPLSTSDLPSGAYFIRCDVAGQRATTRLILQR